MIAIKRILPTMGEDRDFIKMFIDEAKIAGQLAHANICQIFELGRIDGAHFIAMEYIWGKDLLQIQNRLRKIKQQMPVPMACFSIAKVLEGLDYAHRKRDPLGRPLEIVHRDCSPQNVLVSYEGEVKVIDFGIAKATSRNSRTMAGVLKGKFGYMSPEQVRGLPLDRRSDIFALGTMLYECLTGERLFQGETDFSTLEKVRNVDVQNPRDINPAIPESIERVIMKALAKDVDDRYQWCSEMLADLQQYLMSQDVVFTAKSLSAWLKEVFNPEIEKERALLEQYKRVGRDGLIAGVPSAAAKLDVVEHLGEAGQADVSDATQLGGPSFEDIEQELADMKKGAAAANQRNVATTPPPSKSKSSRQQDEQGDGDFGEEAPTEIFGDDVAAQLPPIAAAKPAARPATATKSPASSPPKPPPRAPTQNQPAMAASGASTSGPVAQQRQMPPMGAPMSSSGPVAAPSPSPMGSAPGMAPHGSVPPGGYANGGYPQQHGHAVPMGTPTAVPAQQGLGNPNATMLGVAGQLPPGVNPAANNYGSAYRVTGSHQAFNPPPQQQSYPPQQQSYPPMQQMPPGMQHNMTGPMQHQMPPGMQHNMTGPMQMQYGQDMSGPVAAVPVDAQPPKKKSSMGRDVAIGIVIAAVVLGGFLAVKFLVLDKKKEEPMQSSIATIKMALPDGATAKLFVDDKEIKSVSNGETVDVDAGKRKVKLLGASDSKCEAVLDLPGGKVTPLQCDIKAAPPETKPAEVKTEEKKPDETKAVATPPAETGSGSGSGSGSAAAAATTPTTNVATTDKMPPEEKKPTDKTVEKPPATKVEPFATSHPTTPETKPSESKTAVKVETKTVATPTKTPEIKAPVTKVPEKTPTKTPEKVVTTPVKTPETKATPAATKTDPNGNGYLQVFSKPAGAKVLVDGVDTGFTTPVSGKQITLAPGKHKVSLVNGSDKFTYAVNIKPGATEILSKDL
ncbi:MAG TPA: protein kinase [Kofleriaceae bacterium]